MTKTTEVKQQWFVLGLDEDGKPVGARFPTSDPKLSEVVEARGFAIYQADAPERSALAAQLPEGRIYARGKAFIPKISKSLFDNLQKAVGAAPLASGLPKSWDEVAPGHLVLAEENLPEGWWHAIVISRENDVLTLRYRDYPKADRIKRHIANIALLNPNAT
jgi:hypothetical protein